MLASVESSKKFTSGVGDTHAGVLVGDDKTIAHVRGGANEASNNKTKRVVAVESRLGKVASLEVSGQERVRIVCVGERCSEALGGRPRECCVGSQIGLDLALHERPGESHGIGSIFGG